MPLPLAATAAVLTFNSERTLERCLLSLTDFADLLVLDGGSTDATVDIARRHGARILSQSDAPGPIRNFTVVRERSFALAVHDRILVVDSDEWLDDKLRAAIRDALAADDPSAAWRMERVPIVEGVRIRHAYFVPDMVLRLVDRRTCQWAPGKRVHERLVPGAGVHVRGLPGALLTEWPRAEEFVQKDRHYLRLAFPPGLPTRPPFGKTLKSMGKNFARSMWIAINGLWWLARHGTGEGALPWRYVTRYVRYHFIVVRERGRQFVQASAYGGYSSED